jgi:RNA polymerase-binding transcription factor DksA
MTDLYLSKVLEEKEIDLQQRLMALRKDLQKPHSQDFAEQAVERENDEVLQALVVETEIEIQKIQTALKRIAAGIYGECESCGQPISAERLAAIPESTACIKCAK